MENYCCVFGCNSSTKTHPQLAFFSFPKDDERSEIWLKAIDREDINNDSKNRTAFRVCQLHFESSHILSTSQLDDNAVPTLYLPNTITSSRCFKQEPFDVIVIKDEPSDEVGTEIAADGWLQSNICKQRDTKYNIILAEKYSKLTVSPSEIISIQPDEICNDITRKRLNYTHWTCSTQTDDVFTISSACQTDACLFNKKIFKRSKFKTTPKKLQTFNELCDQFLNEKLARLVKLQAELKYKPQGNKYPEKYKAFCCNMRDRSPIVYGQFKQLLYLPSTRTLCRLKHGQKPVAKSEDKIEENEFNRRNSNTQETITQQEIITEPFDFDTLENDSAVKQDNIATCSNQHDGTRILKRSCNTVSTADEEEDDDDDDERYIFSRKVNVKPQLALQHDHLYYKNILDEILDQQDNFLTSLKRHSSELLDK